MTKLSKAQKKINFETNLLTKSLLILIKDQKKLGQIIAKDAVKRFVMAPNMVIEKHDFNGVSALYCSGGQYREDITLLYFHGGAYTVGSAENYKVFAAHLSEKCGLRAVVPDYRLAISSPYPAAVDDAQTVYKALIDQGQKVVLAGDSAGGGLSFALLHRICNSDLPPPLCVIGLSVWADLTLTSNAITANRKTELMLPLKWLVRARDMYAGETDLNHPELSPVNGEFLNPPPVQLLVGAGEILADDTHDLKARLHYYGGDVELVEREGLPHIWPIHFGRSPEADAAISRMAGFIKRQLPKAKSTISLQVNH